MVLAGLLHMEQLVGGKMRKNKFILSLSLSLLILCTVIFFSIMYSILDVRSIIIGAIIGYCCVIISYFQNKK